MKAKRGGNVDVNKLERLFSDDIAMRTLLSDCNRDEILSFFVNSSNLKGGAKRGREERREEIDDEEELLAAMEEMPVSKRQKKDELEFPDKCSAVQRAIAIFASATIELMYKGASSAAACYVFPEQTQALSNIMSGFLSIIGQNVGGAGTTATIAAIGGFLYAYQRNGNIGELIGKLFSLARQPFPGNAVRSIMKRAVTLCENDLVPIGRNMTVDSIKQSFWNKLGDYGLGPVAEARRQQRQSELARLKKSYAQSGIPVPPPMGMPSRKPMPKSTVEDILREVPRVQALLQSDLSDREKLDNARNMIESVRKEITSARNRKAMIDADIERLEGSEEVIENAAMMELLDQSKAGSDMNAKNITRLLNKEAELLSEIRKLENMPRRLERASSAVRGLERMGSIMEEHMPEQVSLEVEEVIERPKKSKKRRDAEGGKRRTHKKQHQKKSKKHLASKHHKKSAKRHHKKTHKKH